MAGERCEVWWARPASAGPQLLGLLSIEERARHARLRRQADRDRFLVGRSLLRILLAERLGMAPAAVVLAGGDEKPRLAAPTPPYEFSLSHSGCRVVVAVCAATPLGVDVERVRTDRDIGGLIERVLGAQERPALHGLVGAARHEAFYRYWVRKEAAVKATGHGLRTPLAAITVSAPSARAQLLSWGADDPPPTGIRLHDLDPGKGYVGCLASLGAPPLTIEEQDGKALLSRIRK